MKANKAPTFDDLLSFFPSIEPPITLSAESIQEISKMNKVFPPVILEEFVARWETEIDEFTEFVPCVTLSETENYIALIYWKAGLLKHQYILVTLDPRTGTIIGQKVIAGTISDGNTVLSSVAKIEEDLSIHIMVGQADEDQFEPLSSQAMYMEIMQNGDIISQKEEAFTWLNEKSDTKEKS